MSPDAAAQAATMEEQGMNNTREGGINTDIPARARLSVVPSQAPAGQGAMDVPRLGGIDGRRPSGSSSSLPPALGVMIEGVWDRRPVVLHGASLVPDDIWHALGKVCTIDQWSDWLAAAREAAWGKPVPWSRQVEDWSFAEQRHAWWRARTLLGAPLASWLREDDGWSRWHNSMQSRIKDRDSSLEQRARALDAERRKARVPKDDPLPEDSLCTAEALREKARTIALRFGFSRIEGAAGIPLWCMREHLEQAEDGLARLAKSLGWEESAIGGGHLALGWELAPRDTETGYDPVRHMICIGRNGGFGSFVHEWAHAMDHAAAHKKGPGNYRTVEQARDPLADPEPFTHVDHVHASRSVLLGFVGLYRSWRQEFTGEHEGLRRLDDDLNQWIERALDPSRWSSVQKSEWSRWRSRMTLLLTNAPEAWARRFDSICDKAEYLWDKPLSGPGWVEWAKVRDKFEGRTYWAQPHELFARAVHAVVYRKIGAPSWVADEAFDGDLFPLGHELSKWEQRLDAMLPELKSCWQSFRMPKIAHPAP